MSRFKLRKQPRICYHEPEEPSLDEYIFCDSCGDYVLEYCALHGPLLVLPDDKVPAKTGFPDFVPRAALTIPRVFLHLAPSVIPGAGLGVFATLTLPKGVRLGPYRGQRSQHADSAYCWQIFDRNNKAAYVVDAADGNKSNWMRYVNCSRHWCEQNLVAFQYRGQLYYRTIKIIPRFTELMVFYGSEFANSLNVDLKKYNSPSGYAQKFGAPMLKKSKLSVLNEKAVQEKPQEKAKTHFVDLPKDNSHPDTQCGVPVPKKPKLDLQNEKIASGNPRGKVKGKTVERNTLTAKNTTSNSSVCPISSKISTFKNKKLKPNPKTQNAEQSKKPSVSKNNNLNAKAFICNDCTKGFDTKTELIQHIASHSANKLDVYFRCTECSYHTITGDMLEKHMRFHDKTRKYICDSCGYRFTNKQILQKHVRDRHSGDKQCSKAHSCDICHYTTNYICYLKTHLRTHSGEKPFSCSECGRQFNWQSSLKRHLQIHSGEKLYSCSVCDKKFTHQGHLKGHFRIHSGEKPFSCTECGRQFTQQSSLKGHFRIHSGEKPYSCSVCDQKFTQQGHLKEHFRTHSGDKPYSCSVCDKRFTLQGNLKSHFRIHSGEKPYTCSECGRQFTTQSNLKGHFRIHSGEKPYSCSICDMKFTMKGNLKKHTRIHSGEKPYLL